MDVTKKQSDFPSCIPDPDLATPLWADLRTISCRQILFLRILQATNLFSRWAVDFMDCLRKSLILSSTGASFYYLRRILHDWPDSDSLKILGNLAAAMTANSRILIDEVVLPDVNAHWQAAMQDLAMGIELGGKERTRAQWESLVLQAGLQIAHVHTYNQVLYNSVIVLEKQ